MSSHSDIWQFNRLSKSPQWWYNKASDLHNAGLILWEKTESPRPVYLMLCGMSLEALYKAVAVAQEKEVLVSHKLVLLAQHAGLQIGPTEEGPLKVLTHAIIWDGRYPVPKNPDAITEHGKLFHDVMSEPVSHASSLDIRRPSTALHWDHFDKLWTTADELFQNTRNTPRLK